jgi:Putative transposase
MKWQRERLAALPPVVYKGITFTMPEALWRLFRDNKPLADALPALAAGAISALILARYGLRPGVIMILHTFNGHLEFNSHVHTMVTAGGLQASSGSWLDRVYYDNDFLMKLWRRAVLDLLRTAHCAGVLRTNMTSEELATVLLEQERWWSVKIDHLTQ